MSTCMLSTFTYHAILTCLSFTDRDMVMWFLGGAVGHVNTTTTFDLQANEEGSDDEMDVDNSVNHQEYKNINNDEAESLERQKESGGDISEDDKDSDGKSTQSSPEEGSNKDGMTDPEDEGHDLMDLDGNASL